MAREVNGQPGLGVGSKGAKEEAHLSRTGDIEDFSHASVKLYRVQSCLVALPVMVVMTSQVCEGVGAAACFSFGYRVHWALRYGCAGGIKFSVWLNFSQVQIKQPHTVNGCLTGQSMCGERSCVPPTPQ